VIVHEFSHELYGSQPASLQRTLDAVFTETISRESVMAQGLINEGLATSLANGGILYERLTGAVKSTSWYNQPMIDRFARALYPLLTEYLKAGKTMDPALMRQSIERYRVAFKEHPRTIRSLMSNAHISAMSKEDCTLISQELRKLRTIANHRGSSAPITHVRTRQKIEQTLVERATQVIAARERTQLNKLPTEIYEVYQEALKSLRADATSFALISAREDRSPLLILVAPADQELTALLREVRASEPLESSLKVIQLPR
jgi:hypothetical protein